MVKIRLAEHAGFCFGVRRSLALAEQAAGNSQVFSDGPLIHNPQEVERLRRFFNIVSLGDTGVDMEQVAGGSLLIRSHGISPQRLQKFERAGWNIIDATCPYVKEAQLKAQALADEGYQVVIVGDTSHPEVEGLIGWAGGNAYVAANPAAAAELAAKADLRKIGVIAQTTQMAENFRDTLAVLSRAAGEIKIEHTICRATTEHQQAALALAHQVDVMVVVGGKNSSNSKKLAQICAGVCRVYHIETADELHIDIVRGAAEIGVTAGASTPDWIIEEVVEKMMELENLQNEGEKTLEVAAEATPAPENNEPEEALEEVAASEVSEQPLYVQPAEESVTEAQAEESLIEEPVLEEAPAEEDKFAAEYGDMREIRRGARVKGIVVQVKQDELLVDIGGKSEGVLTSAELSHDDAKNIIERFHVGDEIDVLILRKENQEGYPVLSKKRVDQDLAWDKLMQLKAENAVVSGRVTEVVKGGLLVDVGVRGFVPASLVGLSYIEDLSVYIGKEMNLKIVECDKQSNKLVLSAKAVLRKVTQEQKEKTWSSIAEGQTLRGTVRRLTSFGAFVDVGGVDGLLHVSEMAWYRVNHPADLLKEGDELDVYVLSVDQENEKISLGLKQLVPNPWSIVQEKYPEGSVITAKVMRTTTFGAFLEVEPGVEGLVHISQLAHHRVEKTEDVVRPGDEIQVKILAVNPQAKRMSLSIKAALPKEEPAQGMLSETPEGEPMYSTDDPAPIADDPAPVVEEISTEEPAEESAPAEEAPTEETPIEE